MCRRSASFLALTLCVAIFAGSAPSHADDVTVPIVISPSVLNLDSQGVWVTVHAEIPYSRVVGVSVTLDGIPVQVTKADARGELVAKFALDDVKAILDVGTVTLVLDGTTTDGGSFTGSDAIRVIDVSGKR